MTPGNLSIADALFGKAQRGVLALLFGQPDRAFYMREVVAAAGTGIEQGDNLFPLAGRGP